MNPTEAFFTRFNHALRASSVGHCYLRGYSLFPSIAPLSDVDMLVAPQDRAEAISAFRSSASATGFHVWQVLQSGFLTRLFAYRHSPTEGHHFVDVDIHASEATYGVPYFSAEQLLPLAKEVNGLQVLPEATEAMVNSLGHYFSGGSIPEKYLSVWKKHREDAEAAGLLQAAVGSTAASALLEALDADAEILTDGRRIGRATRRRLLFRRPLATALGFLSFAYGERMRPLLQPRGKFVVFLGTDGSGKSTLIKALVERAGPRFRGGHVEVQHLRPHVLPPISALFNGGKSTLKPEDSLNPHRAAPSGQAGSAFRALYYGLDYFLGYPLAVLPKRMRNSLLVFDRWFSDYLVDPRRFRVSPSSPIPRLIHGFLVHPRTVCWVTYVQKGNGRW